MNEPVVENDNSISRFAHVLTRIKVYRNWYSLVWPLNRLGGEDRVIQVRNGPKIYVRSIFGPDWVVVYEMFYRDDYQIAHLPLGIKPVILDIGANIGAFTVLASHCFKDATIYSYEPAATNFEILKKNIALNDILNRLKPFQMAISTNSGEETMTYSDLEYAHSLIADQVETERVVKSEKVTCTTIADIMKDNSLDIIDLIKMDIEGLEYEVLFGVPDEVYKKIRYIALEIHDHKEYTAAKLIEFLEQKGFAVKRAPDHAKVYIASNSTLLK